MIQKIVIDGQTYPLGAQPAPKTADMTQPVGMDEDGALWTDSTVNYELIERIIVGYSVLTEEPEDWTDNYGAYFKNTGTAREPVYTALTEETPWEIGKYYSYSDSGIAKFDRTKEPDGTNYAFSKIAVTKQDGTPGTSFGEVYGFIRFFGSDGKNVLTYWGGFENNCGTVIAELFGKSIYMQASKGSKYSQNCYTTIMEWESASNSISRFSYNCNSGSKKISSSTIIEIYGVRR